MVKDNDWESQEQQRWKNFLKHWSDTKPIVGQTPKKAIWKKNKATLWYYPSPSKKYEIPLYLIYSLVNQPFILDLAPNMSLIEAFGKEGYDVYLIDFGVPGYEDKDMTIDDYLTKYIQPGARRTLLHSGAKGLTVLGFCLGGTLAAIYTSIAEEPVINLVLLTAPVDFHKITVLDKWAEALKKGTVDSDSLFNAFGLVPAAAIKAGMRLVSSPLYFSPYFTLLQKSKNAQYVEQWRRFNMWAEGHIPMPGAALRQLMNDLGKENKLLNDNLMIHNRHASLKNIKANLLTVSTTHDKLVPEEQIKPIMDIVSSKDKTFLSVEGGHASLALTGNIPDYLSHWLKERS